MFFPVASVRTGSMVPHKVRFAEMPLRFIKVSKAWAWHFRVWDLGAFVGSGLVKVLELWHLGFGVQGILSLGTWVSTIGPLVRAGV